MGQIFRRTVERYPETTALVDQSADVQYTYREWYDRATDVAAALAHHGIGAGDRVGVTMRNRIELATLYCATQLRGAAFVPYNFRASASELAYLVNNSSPDVLFFSETTSAAIEDGQDEFETVPDLITVDTDSPIAEQYPAYVDTGNGDFEPTFVDPDRTSLILHTGGTTGQPKGVPRSHSNTYAAATAHAIQASWSQREVTLGFISVSHTMGIHALAAILLLGGTWVSQRRFDAEETIDLIASEDVTSLYLVPTVFHDIIESEFVADADFSSIENITFAGSNMSPADIRAVKECFSPETFINHYGSTEVYTHAVCDRVAEKPNCVGRAGINTRIRIVEPSDFGELDPTATVDGDELGEIIVDTSSPEAFDSYLDEHDTNQTLVDGWFFTGDLGYCDEDSDLYVVGRVDDMIISGGENVYPIEVESVLEISDLTDEVAVVSRPSERWNQTIAAFVTLTADPDDVDFEAVATELNEHCQRSDDLADFKRPRKYFFIDHLSKSNVGKILRKELQRQEIDIPVYAEVDI